MTVTTAPRMADYRGDGATVTFAVPFRFLAPAHLRVVLIDSQGVETAGAVASVAGVGAAAGGTVTLATAPATGVRVMVFGHTPLSQEVDFTPGGAMPGDVVERAFDKLAMGQQEQAEQLSRAVVIPRAAGVTDMAFPAPEANKGLKFDGAGKLVTTRGDFDQLVGRAEFSATRSESAAATAGASEQAAQGSATAAKTSETNAVASATAAQGSATKAKASETEAKASATTAGRSATAAGVSEATARSDAAGAARSATTAKASATKAKTSATKAAGSATKAGASATQAASSASNAAKSAQTAKWSEDRAHGSAWLSDYKATQAAKSETAAQASATKAKASETKAQTSVTHANALQSAAAQSERAAAISATAAAGSATAAAASATKAGASETKAKASQTAAKTSETAAKASETSAAASAVTAQGAAARVSGRIATQAQAEAGTDDNHMMTPQRTAQAIAKQGWRPTDKQKRFEPAKSATTLSVDVTGLDIVDIVPKSNIELILRGGVNGQRIVIAHRVAPWINKGIPVAYEIRMKTGQVGGDPANQGNFNYPRSSRILPPNEYSEFTKAGGWWVALGTSAPTIPAGTIVRWPTRTPPHGWLYCDGSRLYAIGYRELARILSPTGRQYRFLAIPDLRASGHFIIKY